MSEQFDFSIEDDLELDPESYPDVKTGPQPPLPGNYEVKSVKWDYNKDKKNQLILWGKAGDKKYPVIGLKMVEITQPFEQSRKVGVFADIPTMPFEREGKIASKAADLLRAINNEAVAGNTGDVIRQVTEALTGEQTFRVRIDYNAYDKAHAAKLVAEVGPKPAQDASNDVKRNYYDAVNKAYNSAKITGWKRIQQSNSKTEAGRKLGYRQWVGPSGAVCDVRPVITTFYPADENVVLGPDKALQS